MLNSIDVIINTMGIQALPAKEGDCIFVQLPCGSEIYRMLIDCGPPELWRELLLPLFTAMKVQNIKLDVLVITHFDADHIGGAIGLFQDHNLSSVVKEVWFNGLAQIIDGKSLSKTHTDIDELTYQKLLSQRNIPVDNRREDISAKQALTLSALICDKSMPTEKIKTGTKSVI